MNSKKHARLRRHQRKRKLRRKYYAQMSRIMKDMFREAYPEIIRKLTLIGSAIWYVDSRTGKVEVMP